MAESVAISEALTITDEVAEKLENLGLWRRAATRWLEVMYFCQARPTERAQRQRYAAITARECLTVLSMIIIPQKYKKCGGEATCWQTQEAKELALKPI